MIDERKLPDEETLTVLEVYDLVCHQTTDVHVQFALLTENLTREELIRLHDSLDVETELRKRLTREFLEEN